MCHVSCQQLCILNKYHYSFNKRLPFRLLPTDGSGAFLLCLYVLVVSTCSYFYFPLLDPRAKLDDGGAKPTTNRKKNYVH
jgi:hypothetical protein